MPLKYGRSFLNPLAKLFPLCLHKNGRPVFLLVQVSIEKSKECQSISVCFVNNSWAQCLQFLKRPKKGSSAKGIEKYLGEPMSAREAKKEMIPSKENYPEAKVEYEYAIDRLMAYAIGGIGFFLILLKLIDAF